MTRTSYIPTFLTPLSLNHQKLRTRLTTISSESDEDISEPSPHERRCPTSSQPKQCSCHALVQVLEDTIKKVGGSIFLA